MNMMHRRGKGAAMSDSDNHSATNISPDNDSHPNDSHVDAFSNWQGDTAHMPPPPFEEPSTPEPVEDPPAQEAEEPVRKRVIDSAPTNTPPSTAKSSSITLTLNKKVLAIAVAAIVVLVVGGIVLSSALSDSSDPEPESALERPPATEQPEDDEDDDETFTQRSFDKGPVVASKLDIVDSMLYWGRDECLLCAEIDGGAIDNMDQLIEFDDTVDLVAANGSDLYVNTQDTVWLVDVENTPDEATKIIDADGFEHFWLADDGIVYLADGELVYTDAKGDDPETLASDIRAFGLDKTCAYALDEDGEVATIDLATGDAEDIGSADEYSSFAYEDGTVYLVGSEQELMRIEDGTLEEAGLEHPIGDTSKLMFYDGDIFYEGDGGDEFRHSGDDDDENLGVAIFRGEPYGRIEGRYLYYTINGDEITVVDIEDDFEYEDFDVEVGGTSLDDENDDLSSSSRSSNSSRSSSSSGATTDDPDEATPDRPFVGSTTEDIYDIAEAIEMHSTGGTTVLTTSHFTLPLGATNGMGGEWTVYPNSTLTIEFYCTDARNSGQNGLVFTLAAYDWNDNSYSDIPTAQVAGVSEGKKFVVWMPTDLQYDSSDSSQQRLYQDMRNFAESLDMNGNPDGNPFTVLDP